MRGAGNLLPNRSEGKHHIARTSNTAREMWKLLELIGDKPMYAYGSREDFECFLAICKLLKLLVARDGIEPPTPAFSGPRSTN